MKDRTAITDYAPCPVCGQPATAGLCVLNKQAMCPACYLTRTGAFFPDTPLRLTTHCLHGHPVSWSPLPDEPPTSLRVGWMTCPTCKATAT